MKTESNRFIRVVSHEYPDSPTDGTQTSGSGTGNSGKMSSDAWSFLDTLTTTLGNVATGIWGNNPASTPTNGQQGNAGGNAGGNVGGNAGGNNTIIYAGLGVLVLIVILVVFLKK